jgi:hypothetical protein
MEPLVNATVESMRFLLELDVDVSSDAGDAGDVDTRLLDIQFWRETLCIGDTLVPVLGASWR